MRSAILFLIFNRPDTTRQVFEAIRKARPPRLYVAADGPRENRTGEKERCEETRAIATEVDWSCEVHTLFRDKNLGCGRAVSEAITWFFENEPEGIIIEDDILPHPDFFPYCDDLLEKYRDNPKVGMVGGHNLTYGRYMDDFSYGFSAIGHIWGWASWRRAWDKYEYNLSKRYNFKEYKLHLSKIYKSHTQRWFWERIYKNVEKGIYNTWDYQWVISNICNEMLCAVPYVQLTKNIGFTEDATHTSSASTDELNVVTQEILPLRHPEKVELNQVAERVECINSGQYVSVLSEMKRVIKRIIKKIIS